MGGCLAAWLVYRKLLYEEASQPVVKLSPIETDEERREHSCCQLFPVTVDLAERTGMHHYIHQRMTLSYPA